MELVRKYNAESVAQTFMENDSYEKYMHKWTITLRTTQADVGTPKKSNI